jgi:dTDP-4-amino-4,6-dideoxygalactose transaminase
VTTSSSITVPALDLTLQHQSIRDDLYGAIKQVIEGQRFILGDPVLRLEAAVAQYAGASFGVGCASGTDALFLSLKTLDLEQGDEVITTPFTFFATAGAIHNAGGRPVFVDIDPVTFNLDCDQVATAVTSRTRAILPVHLFGQMAAMEDLLAIAARHGLAVIEDAAQAIGARRKVEGRWQPAGSLGTATAFSFFPTKNLGGWGDGGMVVTNDEALADRVRRLRTHGGLKMYHHEEVGVNSRLDALQAAVLAAKLPHLVRWVEGRRRNAAAYTEALAGIGGVTPAVTDPRNEHVFNQYTIRAQDRDRLREHLKQRDIGATVYYPVPLHAQPCFSHLGYAGKGFPHSERACQEVLSLPVYPELTEEQRGAVVTAVREFYA